MGNHVFVTGGVMLEETALAEPSRRREGDIVTGLRTGLFLSAIIWAVLIILAVLIFV
jgi:hypothetical protein